MSKMRIGYGYDVHRLEEGHSLILGGVRIPFTKGLVGHSDADVLIHAIIDAILGACALGDIGRFFPDTDEKFKDIDSRLLLREIAKNISLDNLIIANIDTTIVAEQPKLAPYTVEMRKNIADDLGIEIDQISVKATTSEKIGPEGEGKGISARAAILLTGTDD